MSTNPTDVIDGIDNTFTSLIENHPGGAAINAEIYGDLSNLNIDTDTATALQTFAAGHTSFWDKIYLADPEEYVGDAVKEMTLGSLATAMDAQKALTLSLTTTLISETAIDYTIEQAFVNYLGDLPVSGYVEKSTGRIVISEVIQSSTTHIPIGEYIAGAAKAVEVYLLYETFKNTIASSYSASLGQEDTFTPAKDYLVATTSAVSGIAGSIPFGGPETPWGAVAAGFVGGMAGWATDTLIGILADLIHDAKVNGKTLEETQALARDAIRGTVNDSWNATGTTASDGLTKAGGVHSDLLDALKAIVPDTDLSPRAALPNLIGDDIQPAFASAISAASPLVIDLSTAHSGVTLTSWNAATTTTFFDLNDNGFGVQTAWVSGDTGLLARDLDSNGLIDSSAELFGSPTVDGFAKLAALDSNHDLRIDNNDDDWSTLVVWTDDNGVTESGELHSLSSLGIVNIDLAGVASSTSTISGNPISHVSTVTFSGGATATIADAWFVHDNTNSYYADDYTLDVETLFLPTLRGYGSLADLTIAMSQDSDLKDLVTDLASSFTLASFADAAALNDELTDILYAWAGVSSVSPASRGTYVNAQHLGFLEHFIGTEYRQLDLYSNPFAHAGAILEQTYQTAFNMLSAHLLLQIGAAELFDEPVTYNAATGAIDGDMMLSQDALDTLAGLAPPAGSDNEAFWIAIGRFIEGTKGLASLTSTELSWLEDAVNSSDPLLHWTNTSAIVAAEIQGSGTDDTLYGDSSANIIHGNDGNDIIQGNNGNDTLYGDAGNDTLYGGSNNDTLYGGDGNDSLFGSLGTNSFSGGAGGNTLTALNGNDTFVFDGGEDVISDTGGTDQIVLSAGIVLGDLHFSRISNNQSTSNFYDLYIDIDGGGSIQINRFFQNSTYQIESILFSDSSTLNLTTLAAPDVYGTAGNDNLAVVATGTFAMYGGDGNDYVYAASSGTHVLSGGNGNDQLRGNTGNDTYIASAGYDTIEESGSGTDTIVIPDGFTLSDLTFYRINNVYGPTTGLGIIISGLGEITISSQLSAAHPVEYLHFDSDNTTVSLTNISVATIGSTGNDTLNAPTAGTNQNDTIDGREGNDYMAGGLGNDTYVFSVGHDTINDTGGSDTIVIRNIYDPADLTVAWNFSAININDARGMILTDSDGNTLIVQDQSYTTSNVVDLIAFGDGTTWHLSSMELATYGTSSADTLYGHDIGDASSADTIYGYGGNDGINGGNGNDLLYGGDGNDTIYGNAGNDTIYGGDGADAITAWGGDGNDAIYGDAGNDTLKGADHSVLHGGDGDDILSNIATSTYAAGAVVTLYGDSGADNLTGLYGQTTLNGGTGADTLNGSGSGVDTFEFDAASAFDAVDTINVFQKTGTSHDKIDISDILDGFFDPLTEVITNFVQITTNGYNSELYVDTTGTGTFGAGAHIATIQSVTGLTDEADLLANGLLIAA